MPSTLPSSFASAAAGSIADSQARAAAARGDASFAEWSRRPNGATQTFRRSSSAMTNANTAHSREPSNTPSAASAYVPPHLAQGRNGAAVDTRYSKSQLLDLYREQQQMGDLDNGLSDLFVGDWDPNYTNGGGAGNKWTRGQETASDMAPGPETCFERSQEMTIPSGLFEMSDEERELFTTSVNSTLKGPNQNTGQRDGPNARKISFSTGTQPLNSVNSPTAGRPMNRRRETAESQSITSPRVNRDENPPASPPPSLMRRRTDLRDALPEERSNSGVGTIGAPVGTLKRSSTQPFGAAPSNPTSPWSAGPAGNPMGSFGNFTLGNAGRPGMGARGESRFRGLMSRESAEEMGARSSMSNLGRLEESGSGTLEDEAYTGEGHPIGSAALGGDSPPPGSVYPEYNTPARQRPALNTGLSGLGGDAAGTGAVAGAGFPGQNQYGSVQPSSQQSQQPHQEPMSPTYTNPYQSPEHSKHRLDDGESEETNDSNNFHLPGLGGYRQDGSGNPAAFNARMANANFGDVQGFERANNSSATGHRGFSGLVGLGGLGGLGGQDSTLRSPATMQSPALAGLGGSAFAQPSASGSQAGSIGRGNSRLGSLFPTGMQDQMRSGGRPLDAQSEGTDENSGSFGNNAFTPGQHPHRDTDSPFRSGRGKFEDFFAPSDKQDPSLDAFMRAQMGGQAAGVPGQGGPQRMPSNVGSTGSSQPPAPQQKTMVMPDRIRWIYRDPQGNTQGPWSGLEMHDWYRAGFFSPELLVKKVEDPDYEPLAQLIRRIGNSREPFLVPQIGIPGPPSSQGGWPNQHPAPGPANPGAQPPFAGSFPSFGTTLTAEQQNALERRKQEEQYLMARQKEHLAQQQFLVKQLQMQGHMGGYPTSGLQHHSSANSLHSQPSYGSITSPSGFQPTPMAAPGSLAPGSNAAFSQAFDNNAFRGAIGSGLESLGDIKEEDLPALMNRLGVGAPDAGALDHGSQDHIASMQQPGSAAFAERARLQQEAAEQAAREEDAHHQVHGDGQRLKQFQALQQDQMHAELKHDDDLSHEPHDDDDFDHIAESSPQQSQDGPAERDLTLTEQVQKAASAKQSPAHTGGAWGIKAEQDAPTTVAPPQSSSPLPAPAARRKHGNMADQLDVESVGPSGSPSVETPTTSVAPWATQAAEAQKQPSLKEIQEAEARRAARQEEINQAARRAALEREIAASQAAAAASASALPSSSTWGSGSVEPSPTTTNAPWAKMNGGKVTPSAAAKKTLQQIQKEEEARKNKAMAAAALNVQASSLAAAAQLASGKRHADLAAKSGSPVSAAAANTMTAGGTGAWTTVGAGGKAKPPPGPAAPSLQRTASTNLGRAASTTVPKPAAPVRANTIANTPASAMESLRKWAVAELRPDLNKGLTPEGFVGDLMNLGTDTGLITEAVHQSSQTIDSRHFAEEFVRRRVLADKGTSVEAAGPVSTSSASGGAGGWSEVARKGPAKTGIVDDSDAAFKVVAAKKKGGRK